MFPDFGKAGMPYAKSCRSVKALHGAKPDPGLLFDRGCQTQSLCISLFIVASPYGKARRQIQSQSGRYQ